MTTLNELSEALNHSDDSLSIGIINLWMARPSAGHHKVAIGRVSDDTFTASACTDMTHPNWGTVCGIWHRLTTLMPTPLGLTRKRSR